MAETPLARAGAARGRCTRRPCPSRSALKGDDIRLIAEVKKASPSAGLLRADFDPAWLASTYAASGAAAISCLTDAHFEGTLEHLREVKTALAGKSGVPVLRKDFLTHPVPTLRGTGVRRGRGVADRGRAVGGSSYGSCCGEASNAGVQCLVEVHDEIEMAVAAEAGAEVIGINNRDLRTFKTDLAVTGNLASKAPAESVLVSESGIRDRGRHGAAAGPRGARGAGGRGHRDAGGAGGEDPRAAGASPCPRAPCAGRRRRSHDAGEGLRHARDGAHDRRG